MTDDLLSWCLGLCRLRASWLTGAAARIFGRLLWKGPGIREALLHRHTAEPRVHNAFVCDAPCHLQSSWIGFTMEPRVPWQISYDSTMEQRQLLEFPAVSGLISFVFGVIFPGLCVGEAEPSIWHHNFSKMSILEESRRALSITQPSFNGSMWFTSISPQPLSPVSLFSPALCLFVLSLYYSSIRTPDEPSLHKPRDWCRSSSSHLRCNASIYKSGPLPG